MAAANAAKGQPQRAIELMNAELKRISSPNAIRAIFGRLALLMKKPDLAIEQYTTLTRDDPKSARTHYMLAEALGAKGDSPAAIVSLERAERLDPNDPDTLSALASLLQASGRSSEAVSRLRRVLELRPGATSAVNDLAYALAESGVNLEEARQLAQKALQAAPNQAEYADTLGWIYLKTKMTDSAFAGFPESGKKRSENPVYLYHLAVAQLQKGQKAAGRATLEVALENRRWHSLRMQIRDTMARGD